METWNFHLNYLKDKVYRIYYKLCSISKATWDLEPNIIKLIYKSVTERIVLYGCIIYYNGNVKMKVKVLQ